MTEQSTPAAEPENQAAPQPAHPSVHDFLVGKLQLARERVVAPDLGEKDAKRAKLDELIVRMSVQPGEGYERPTAAELRDALGDPDEADIRHALDEWDVV